MPEDVEQLKQAFGKAIIARDHATGQIGIAVATLIESTVRVTTRHNDNAPIASVAATASFRRDEATGAVRPLKPQAPDDLIMVGILQCAGESPAALRIIRDSPAILRRQSKMHIASKTPRAAWTR